MEDLCLIFLFFLKSFFVSKGMNKSRREELWLMVCGNIVKMVCLWKCKVKTECETSSNEAIENKLRKRKENSFGVKTSN